MLQNMPSVAGAGPARAESRISDVFLRVEVLQKKLIYLNELMTRLAPFQRTDPQENTADKFPTRATQPQFYETLHNGLDTLESYIDSAVSAISRVEV